jgi:hypothetical protein
MTFSKEVLNYWSTLTLNQMQRIKNSFEIWSKFEWISVDKNQRFLDWNQFAIM